DSHRLTRPRSPEDTILAAALDETPALRLDENLAGLRSAPPNATDYGEICTRPLLHICRYGAVTYCLENQKITAPMIEIAAIDYVCHKRPDERETCWIVIFILAHYLFKKSFLSHLEPS